MIESNSNPITFVADIELSLTIEELTKLKQLALLRNCDIAEAARFSIVSYCDQVLKEHKEALTVDI